MAFHPHSSANVRQCLYASPLSFPSFSTAVLSPHSSLQRHRPVVEDITMSVQSSPPKRRSSDEEDNEDTYHETIKQHTKNDRADMSRMGKIQELRVPNHSYGPKDKTKADTPNCRGTTDLCQPWLSQ
jgi:hypothetical protein